MAKQNKGRKFFAASATAALVASAIVPVASAATIKDFDKVAPYAKEAVQALVDAGVITGDEKGNFNPTNTITRAEAAKIFAGALELEAEGSVDFKDVKKDAWYYDAIAATVEYGIFEGVSATEFAPTKQLTRSEAAKILVEAFELEGEADLKDFADASTVKPWAKSYLEIAVSNGIIKGTEVNGKTNLNPNASITRQEFAVVFSRALELADETVKIDKIEVVDAKTLNVTLSDGTKETVTLEKALEANKETEVTFKIKDVEYKAKVTYVVTTATAVKSVSATNLKQVVVEFDGKVDPATASEEGNYAITGTNDPVVDTAVVSEDGRSVTLTLKDKFENQSEYKLSLNNIKAGDKVLNAKDVKFKPLDNTVPTVAKVEALGNKTVRVHFSEPVKAAQTSQFQIDGKVVVGSIQTNLNTVIIKLSSALTDGEHTLTAEGTEDYNNFKTVKADTKFNVVEDKTAPTVSVVSASFEKVVLKFSEPVEQVFASNIYWMQGGAKKQASSVKQLADDKYEFTFTGDNKLVYTTDLFVTNVKDYSGNVIDKDTKVQVTPVIDQTRPEVISTTFVKDSNNKQITIKFTKSLDADIAKKAANYVIKDKDGKVQPISSTVNVSKDKEVTITLLGSLKDNNDYTLSVTGVADNTTLKNVMLPYTTTLSVKDVTAPKLLSVTRLNEKQLYVAFDEAMATSGDGNIADVEKYTVTDKDGKKLTIAGFDVTQDAKGVILKFNNPIPEVDGKFKVKVQLVKDLAGNYLDGLHAEKFVAVQNTTTIESVEATAKNKVEVEFSNPIQSLVQGDFSITGSEIAHNEISTDGKTVTFTLKTDLAEDAKKDGNAVTLTVKSSPSTVDVLGKAITGGVSPVVADKIAATVDTEKITAVDNRDDQIKLTFNEAVKLTAGGNPESDFIVKDGLKTSNNNVKVTKVELDAKDATNKTLILTLEKSLVAATVEVTNPRFVEDLAGNVIAKIAATSVELDSKGAATTLEAAKTALSTAITAAETTAAAPATEGKVVGNKVEGSKAALTTAITTAKSVNTATATLQQLTDAKTALDAAVTKYTNAAVVAITPALANVTLAAAGESNSATTVTLAQGETLEVTSATPAQVTAVVDSVNKVKVTHVAAGTSVITVNVLNADGKVVKTGTFTVTAN
ncbi:S-layer homology domain-containing protein [Lysinibacillus xylanilyticus]|uniref:S-layer homology domain-containing protein n=1 Tax=Lysinibacillus xylanilyticus TaxID=582475 RepID=UPI00382D6653